MTEPICISFTPSREYADAMRQQMNIRDGKGYGATAGDMWHLGLRGYDVIDPFIKSREQEERQPITCPGWRERIDKAKRDIEKHKSEQRVQLLAESISDEQILTEIEAIRQWANSLKQTQSQTGLLASTPAGMS